MFKLVHRSISMRSLRNGFGGGGKGTSSSSNEGGGAGGGVPPHGPESPVFDKPAFVSDSYQHQHGDENPHTVQNAVVPPFVPSSPTYPDIGHSYVRRPLPPPPPRASETGAMATRPSTSAGTSSKMSGKNQFERRISRDDLYLTTKRKNPGGYRSYHIPIRGKPPSPSSSPRSQSPVATLHVRTQTPDSMDGPTEAPIGMALGSPSFFPAPGAYAAWQPQHSRPGTSFDEASEDWPPKQKTAKWKLFGRFGGKKHTESNKDSPDPPTFSLYGSRPTTSAGKGSSALERSNTSQNVPRHRPLVMRSQTEPVDPPAMETRESKAPKNLGRKASNRALKKSDISAPIPVPVAPAVPPPSFLDVKIPDIRLERYSVMFSSVLQSQGQNWQAQQAQSQSSLLLRRQATLDKLRSINDAIVKEVEEKERGRLLVRRATSPQPTKSPAFSLFPSAGPTRNLAPVRFSPRSRSNTSPAHLSSPAKEGFNFRPQAQPQQEMPRIPKLRYLNSSSSLKPNETPLRAASSERRKESGSVEHASIPIVLEPGMVLQTPVEVPAPLRIQPRKPVQTQAQQLQQLQQSQQSQTSQQSSLPGELERPNRKEQAERADGPNRPEKAGRRERAARRENRERAASSDRTPEHEQTQKPAQKESTQPTRTIPQPRKPIQPQPQQASVQSQPVEPVQKTPALRTRIPQPIQIDTRSPVSSFGPGKSALMLDSPVSDGEPDMVLKVQARPSLPEPSWQMISPPSSTTSSSASSMRKRTPSSASSVQTHLTKPSIDDPDVMLKNAVEISIARQINLSKQQRQLLQPLQTNIAKVVRHEASPSNASGRSPSRKLAVGKNERLAETKSSTPTLIHPAESFDSHLAQHRKSERIVVEAA